MKISTIILEAFVNLLPNQDSEKEKYKEQVFDLLQKTYETVGGIKGNGFGSPDEMIKKIPFWKLKLRSGKLTAGAMYKDKNGRKRVAVFNDQTEQGDMFDLMSGDLNLGRAYVEVSKGSLSAIKKRYGIDFVKKHAISVDKVKKISDDQIVSVEDDDPEVLKHPELKDFFYRREISGHLETKIMLGTPGKNIYF